MDKELLRASKQNHQDLTKDLVKNGADVNTVDGFGNTLLHYACANGNLEEVDLLIKNGADINVTNKFGDTSLHYACAKGSLEVVKYLVEEFKADINSIDEHRRTPLDMAIQKKDLELVNYLEERGALSGEELKEKANEIEAKIQTREKEDENEINVNGKADITLEN